MTYLFIILLHGQSYILDSGLTRADCGRAIVEGVESVVGLSGNRIPINDSTVYICQVENPQ